MVDEVRSCSTWGLEPEPYPSADPATPRGDRGDTFEAAALAVAARIQPTATSEARRAAVVDYVQRVIRCTVGCEVFPFGSVPLKTYLPDGDIDLTGFGPSISDENLAKQVQSVLEFEEMRDDAEFEVKEVQYINAEVKLVKCIVQNIIVDISFNQFGGLCALCFLEQVDQKFEKNHLFKKSIMLIKAWCYYESRILGAHHGLISTYALEILVLHVFHLFHESLDSPLVVLYRFLDYYSKFDWDNKGISLYGPISLSSLPELVTDPLDIDDDAFLKREEFLKECAHMFTVPPRNTEQNTRVFARKFFNIVDPLKQSNNLGRSVSKGNFIRIRSAFHFGARKLGKILQLPANSTLDEVKQFFRNTLMRHCTRVRPDVQEVALGSDAERADNGCLPLYSNSFGDLSDQFNNISISDSSNYGSLKQKQWDSVSDPKEMKSVSGGWLASNATNSTSLTSVSDFCESTPPSTTAAYSLPSGKDQYEPHLLNESENGEKVGINHDANLSRHGMSTMENVYRSHHSFEEVDGDGGAINGNLPDLTGDYRTHLNNLLYAQGFYLDYPTHQYYPTSQVYYQMLPPPPAQYQNKRSSNGHSRKNAYGYAGTNGIGPGPCPPGYFVVRPYSQIDDPRGTPGTGTFFPDPTLSKDRSPTGRGGRGKGHFLPPYHQRSHHYGRADMSSDFTHSVELRRPPPPPFQVYIPGANDLGIPSPLRIPIPSPSSGTEREMIHDNGFVQPQDRKVEFGTLRALPLVVTSQEHAVINSQPSAHENTMSPAQNPASNNQPSSPARTMSPAKNPASNNQPSAPASTMSPAQNRGMGSNRTRNAQPYRLKDKGDFPPLSS